jgi:hypothetical protein
MLRFNLLRETFQPIPNLSAKRDRSSDMRVGRCNPAFGHGKERHRMNDGREKSQPFLTICAWTKKVRFEGHWLSIEDYLNRAHGIIVTHGICPDASSALELNIFR